MRVGVRADWLCVMLLCALVAALMSTADSGLMAIAAMVVNDLVAKRRPADRPLSTAQALWLARGATVAACVVLVLCLWGLEQARRSERQGRRRRGRRAGGKGRRVATVGVARVVVPCMSWV